MSWLPNETHNNAGFPIPQKTKNELFLEQLQNKDGGDQFLTIPADLFLTSTEIDFILKMISEQHKYTLNLEIDLTVMPIEHLTQLIYLANHLRYRPATRSAQGEMQLILSITDRSAHQNNFEKISYFLQSLTNDAFTSLKLCSPFLNLKDIEPKIYADQLLEFFHKMAPYLKKFKSELSLQNFHLNIIGVKAILSIMQKIDVFRFSLHVGNDLYKLDLKDLTELFSAIKPAGQSEQPSKCYYFWDYHDFDKSFLAFSKSWNQQQRLQFIQLDVQHFQMARIYYSQELNLALAPSTPAETETAIQAFLAQFARLGDNPYLAFQYSQQIGFCIQQGTLSYTQRKSLAHECLALNCFPGISVFNLAPKDQLPLVLRWLEPLLKLPTTKQLPLILRSLEADDTNTNFHSTLKSANLYNSDLPICSLLRAWESYTNLTSNDKDALAIVYEMLISDVLPKLQKACELIWKENEMRFYDSFFQKVAQLKIQSEYDVQKLLHLMQWFTYLALTNYQYAINHLDRYIPFFEEVMKYEESTMRYMLIKLWADIMQNPKGAELFDFLTQSTQNQNSEKSAHSKKNEKSANVNVYFIPSIFIASILLQSPSNVSGNTKVDVKEKEKNTFTSDQYALVPTKLKTIPHLNEAQAILNALPPQYLQGNALKTLVDGFALLTNAKELSVAQKVQQMQNVFDLKTPLRKIFNLSDAQVESYNHVVAGLRNEGALLTYLGKLRSLKDEEARALETLYHRFVHAILTKDSAEFYQIRYQNLKHLEAVFRRRPLLREQWPHRLEFDLDTFIASYQLKPKLPYGDLEKFIYSKIFLHHHIQDPKSLTHLKTYLESTDPDIRKNIFKQLEKEAEDQKSISEAIPPAEDAGDYKSMAEVNSLATKTTLGKPIVITLFQKALIELMETNPIFRDKQAELAQSALTQLITLCHTYQMMGYDFMNDLRALQKSFKSLKFNFMPTSLKDWKISFTDHFWTLLLIGTDVPGSFQRVDGDPELNKALLAYLMDGKNKAIVIQDETGKTHARAIIRLLLDAKTNEPVLYFEQIYPDFVAPLFREALLQCATLVANALDLSLLAKEGYDDAQDYPESVMSLGSVGPEYVDALHDERDEPYEIPQSKVLFSAYPQGRAIVTQFLSSQKVINTVFDYLYSDDHREGSVLNFKAFGK